MKKNKGIILYKAFEFRFSFESK